MSHTWGETTRLRWAGPNWRLTAGKTDTGRSTKMENNYRCKYLIKFYFDKKSEAHSDYI